MMKIVKQLIFICSLFLICGALISKDKSPPNQEEEKKTEKRYQDVLREENKLQFSISHIYGNSFFNFQYNWNSKFSIGTSLLHYEKNDISYIPYYYFLETEKKRTVGQIYGSYFLFRKIPIYITGGISRNFMGQSYTLVDYAPSIPNVYMEDIVPEYFYNVGLGFQWIFQNGLIFGISGNIYQPINRKRNEHHYSLIIDQNTLMVDFNSIFIASKWSEITSSWVLDSKIPKIMLWIGYAF